MTKTAKKIKYQKEELITSYAVILPSFILLTLFVVIPLIISFVNSFYESSAYIESLFVQFKNYKNVLTDSAFWNSILVGGQFTLCIVPLQIVLAFILAHVMQKANTKISAVLKICVYLPCLLSGIIVGALFNYIYAYDGGLLNWILGGFGIEPIAFTSDPKFALISVCIASIWSGLGYVGLVILGGLMDIPTDYFEAAKIDGAGNLRQMWYITIPSLKNLSVYLIVTSFVSSYQLFELPFIMTGGGPVNMTLGPVGFLYYHFTWDKTLGYTYAASIIVAIVLTLISSIVFRLMSSEKAGD